MALANGTKLGPYLIETPAGAGGMGEVYKAKDTRLERIVAIKVLPTHIADNTDLRQRFDREAKAISSLNHPNICTLHDVGHENGTDYLVMEYLDGETLAMRLTKGAIPATELLTIATQIADALDKAHRQGLVHRDLKPGNIMLTKGGAKLMDFGLAKLQQAGGVVQGVSAITRTSTPLTGEGTILGTLQYMSPEQLEGKETDARSDIFSFGVILYEMATGKRAFEGGSQASLIAAILREDPRPVSELQPLSPPMLDRVIKQCLEKDQDHRWQAAGDLKRALQWISEGGSQVGIPIAVSSRRRTRERALWGAVAVLGLAATALAALHFLQPKTKPVVARFAIAPARGLNSVSWPKISPDGSMIAFSAVDSSGQAGIFVRPINSLEAHLLIKVQSVDSRPFWSPDSKQVAFFESSQLKKVSIAGGLAQLVCEAANGYDGSWGSGGMIVFDGNRTDSIRMVPASGGPPAAATKIDRTSHETMAGWPWFLPDGEHFLYLAFSDSSAVEHALKVASIHSFETITLTKVNSRVEYVNGYLVYIKNNLLVAHPFDAGKLRLTGEPVPLSSNVSAVAERALFGVSENGILVYQSGQSIGLRDMLWVNRHGDSLGRLGSSGQYMDFVISPDGSRVAYGQSNDQQNSVDIWVRDLKREVSSRLTFGPSINVWPVWNNDGTKIFFTSNRDGKKFFVMQRNANGTGADETVLALDSADVSVTDVSRDGNTLTLTVSERSGDIWQYHAVTKKSEPLLTQPYSEQRGALSPNGRFMAYQSAESGRPEIYIRELGATGGKWQVSATQGRCPKWRADGRELYYFTPDFDFIAVPIAYDHGLEIGAPTKLFTHRVHFSGANTLFPYDVSADGQKFLMLTPTDGGHAPEFVVVQNWAEELKK